MYPAMQNNSDDPGSQSTSGSSCATPLRLHRPREASGSRASRLPGRMIDVSFGGEARPLGFSSPQMAALMEKASRYARSSAPILISGETGTGKELLCRHIHRESMRARKNFVAVNCAALPELLVESELFGHERGAFTGAFQHRVGHFQFAHRGTLMLDEITEVPVSVQAKLLRAIEEQEVLKIGSSQPEKVDVRILATSNRDLASEVQEGSFRLDLFHRLNVLSLRLPPLREREDDILFLADYFLKVFRAEATRPIEGFTDDALAVLTAYSWPGNIRELKNVIQCACIECDSGVIDSQSLPPLDAQRPGPANSALKLEDAEKQLILASLEKHRGNKTAAAAELGVTSRTLANKLKLYHAA